MKGDVIMWKKIKEKMAVLAEQTETAVEQFFEIIIDSFRNRK